MFSRRLLCGLFLVSIFPHVNAASDFHFINLQGKEQNPFDSPAHVRVLLFVRTDCPITNRYAPELQRIARRYKNEPVEFWLIYADRTETPATIRRQVDQYDFPGTPLLDPYHRLVARAQALTAPEAAVFDRPGRLRYHGRIDNRWVSSGKSRPSATVHDLEDAVAATLLGKPARQSETEAVGCSLADIR